MINQQTFSRCNCSQCQENRKKYGVYFDVISDELVSTLIKNLKELAIEGKGNQEIEQPVVKIVGDVPPELEEIIRAAITEHFKQQNPLQETISLAEKYRLVSIRKADPEEDTWGEDDTEESEPDWLKQDAQTVLELEQDLEGEDSSLLTLVEALRQQILASRRLNASALSILEILTEQL